MRTTEVFVEQVIIGSEVILIGALPFLPELWHALADDDAFARIGTGAVAVAVAYVLGIVFDRFADSLLDRVNAHNRLRFAIEKFKAEPCAYWEDPFPERRYQAKALSTGGSAGDWSSYLRARIRLARALAVFLPGMTASAVLLVARIGLDPISEEPGLLLVYYSVLAIAGVYLLAFVLVLCTSERCRAAPLTSAGEGDVRDYGEDRGYFSQEEADKRKRAWTLPWDLLADPAVWGGIALLFGTCVMACYLGFERSLLWTLPVGGFTLTVIAAWSWWRMSHTYWRFLESVGKLPQKGG